MKYDEYGKSFPDSSKIDAKENDRNRQGYIINLLKEHNVPETALIMIVKEPRKLSNSYIKLCNISRCQFDTQWSPCELHQFNINEGTQHKQNLPGRGLQFWPRSKNSPSRHFSRHTPTWSNIETQPASQTASSARPMPFMKWSRDPYFNSRSFIGLPLWLAWGNLLLWRVLGKAAASREKARTSTAVLIARRRSGAGTMKQAGMS